MLDQEDRDVGWQSGEGGEDVLPLFLRHAGGGFVQQQHLRARRKREGDLQESLLTVRELPGRLIAQPRALPLVRQSSRAR